MSLYEGEESSYFESYTDWSITVTEVGENASGLRYSIAAVEFEDLPLGKTRTFSAADLPFDVELSRYMKNSQPRLAENGDTTAVDGVVLQPVPAEPDDGMNFRGVFVAIVEKASDERHDGVLAQPGRGTRKPSTFSAPYRSRMAAESNPWTPSRNSDCSS